MPEPVRVQIHIRGGKEPIPVLEKYTTVLGLFNQALVALSKNNNLPAMIELTHFNTRGRQAINVLDISRIEEVGF